MSRGEEAELEHLYCARCQKEVSDPLACGDCGAVHCRRYGSPREKRYGMGVG
jgi:hypothetical protein